MCFTTHNNLSDRLCQARSDLDSLFQCTRKSCKLRIVIDRNAAGTATFSRSPRQSRRLQLEKNRKRKTRFTTAWSSVYQWITWRSTKLVFRQTRFIYKLLRIVLNVTWHACRKSPQAGSKLPSEPRGRIYHCHCLLGSLPFRKLISYLRETFRLARHIDKMHIQKILYEATRRWHASLWNSNTCSWTPLWL